MTPAATARADQIVAVLCDADEPLSTFEVAIRAASGGATYMTLVRLARAGSVIKVRRIGRDAYWRVSAMQRREVDGVAALVEDMVASD